MSHTTNESDGIVYKDQTESSLAEDICGNGGIVLKKGPWTAAEDAILIDYVKRHGEGNWNAVQKHSGLSRCGKSCRLRWANHLRPNLKKGAFTQEEEQLILELHAKMGNKWARMATHLPGRTDNEIKNYWNTRIKRRQRAGLPLYPPEVSLLQDNQRCPNMGGINTGEKGHNDLLRHNSYEIPDFIFDSLKPNQGVSPYVPEFPDITQSSMLIKGLGSSQHGSFISPVMHRQKRLRESATSFHGYSGSLKDEFPLFENFQDESCDKAAQSFFGFSFQDSHTLANGDISARKPSSGPVKSELPSIQYPENDLGLGCWGTPTQPLLQTVDTFIPYPPAGTVESSPRNSGLLEALLYEAKTLSSAKNHSSDKSSNSSTVSPGELAETSALNICDNIEWEEYGDPLFSECTPTSASGSSLEEAHPAETFAGCNVKSELVDQAWSPEREEKTDPQLDNTRSDAVLASDWLGQSSGYIKDRVITTDNIANLLGDDLSSDYKQMLPNQGLGFSSCAWNAMPAVCQMSELP